MTTIRYLSDLHLEFIKPKKIDAFLRKIPTGKDEICILAGDIGNPYQSNYTTFMRFISANFKQTFVIAGNHEYYNETKSMSQINMQLKQYFAQFDNICFLDNSIEYYDGFCFIGTTLWSKITDPRYAINDVYSILHFDHIKYNKLNTECVQFLDDALQHNDNCIVITHHMPLKSLIHEKYKTTKMAPYNQWFYCDMHELIKRHQSKIKCWIYGHTHTPSNIRVNEISFLCNPIGYPNENSNVDFGASFVI